MDPSDRPSPAVRPDARLAPGTMVGRYRILEFRARGGMGEVYLGEDTALQRRVALKRMAARPGGESPPRDLILREGRRAGRLSDPRIVALHDVVEHAGEIFLVMEFVEGVSAREKATGRLPLDQFWDLAVECTKALEVAHRHGIVHLDVKPDNIMVTPAGHVKMLDFGISRRIFARESETTTLMSPDDELGAGTPAYMPPEAHLDMALDERADIYSLGVVFFELLAGERPFSAGERGALVNQVLHLPPPRLDSVRADVPPDLAELIGRMLAKSPADRPGSTSKVLELLLAVRRGEPLPPPGSVTTVPLPRRRSTFPVRLVLGGAIAATLAALAFSGPGKRLLVRWGIRDLPAEKNLAVLPFTVAGDESNKAAFALGLAERMTTSLTRASATLPLQVTPTEETEAELGTVLTERNGKVDRAITSLARARLGANLVIAGHLEKNGDSIRVSLSLLDAATAGTLRQRRVNTTLARFPRLANGALALLGFSDPDSAGRPVGTGETVPGTFYLRGWGELLAARTPADADRSIKEFELAISMNPESAAAVAGLSRAYMTMNRITGESHWVELAAAKAREAVALDPEDAGAHKALGLALTKTADVEGARRALGRAAALDPTDDLSLYEYARSYGRRKDYRTEDSLFTAYVAARPDYWRPYWWLATSYYKQGRLDEAIVPYRKMAELAPDFYKSYSNLGAIYLSRGRYDRAAEACRKSAELNPAYTAYSNLATAYFYLRRFADAVATYRKALELDVDDYAVWLNLGDAYYWGYGKPGEAERAYRTAVKLGEKFYGERPYDGTILADLAAIQSRLSQPDSARSRIERALRVSPGNPFVFYDAALTYWQFEDTTAALGYLEKAVDHGYPPLLIRDSAVFDAWRREPRFAALFPPPPPTTDTDSTRTTEDRHGKES